MALCTRGGAPYAVVGRAGHLLLDLEQECCKNGSFWPILTHVCYTWLHMEYEWPARPTTAYGAPPRVHMAMVGRLGLSIRSLWSCSTRRSQCVAALWWVTPIPPASCICARTVPLKGARLPPASGARARGEMDAGGLACAVIDTFSGMLKHRPTATAPTRVDLHMCSRIGHTRPETVQEGTMSNGYRFVARGKLSGYDQ